MLALDRLGRIVSCFGRTVLPVIRWPILRYLPGRGQSQRLGLTWTSRTLVVSSPRTPTHPMAISGRLDWKRGARKLLCIPSSLPARAAERARDCFGQLRDHRQNFRLKQTPDGGCRGGFALEVAPQHAHTFLAMCQMTGGRRASTPKRNISASLSGRASTGLRYVPREF